MVIDIGAGGDELACNALQGCMYKPGIWLLFGLFASCDPTPACQAEVGDTGGDGGTGDEPRCGDGTKDDGEACDDGNTVSGDGCSDACAKEEDPSGYCCEIDGRAPAATEASVTRKTCDARVGTDTDGDDLPTAEVFFEEGSEVNVPAAFRDLCKAKSETKGACCTALKCEQKLLGACGGTWEGAGTACSSGTCGGGSSSDSSEEDSSSARSSPPEPSPSSAARANDLSITKTIEPKAGAASGEWWCSTGRRWSPWRAWGWRRR